jgi:hypothetical protein
MRARIAVPAVALLIVLATAGSVTAVGAVELGAFDATFAGSSSLSGPDQSPVFGVTEQGSGSEVGIPSGSFAYELWVVQDTRLRPDGCGPNSSTGRAGMATLTFGDGELRLRRIGGEACFAFPFVTGTEEWVALGGSGPYRSSTAVLTRAFTLDVRTGSVTGSGLRSEAWPYPNAWSR